MYLVHPKYIINRFVLQELRRVCRRVCRVSDDEGLVRQSKEMTGLVLVLVEVAEIEYPPLNCLYLFNIINHY